MQSNFLHKLVVVKIVKETAAATSFYLQALDWQPLYKPGQFITLVFGEKRRSYSLVSQPGDEYLQITIKRVANGEYSRKLIDTTQPGDEWFTTDINGFFVLPDDHHEYKQYFFLAAGSGITPAIALVEQLLLQQPSQPITLVYSNSSPADTIFEQRLLQLAAAHSSLQIEWLYSHNFSVRHGRLSSHLLQLLLKQYVADISTTLFYICGPFDYMLMAQITLLSYGITVRQIRKEQFSTLPRIIKQLPPDTAAHTVTVHSNGISHQLRVQYPSTILAAAKKEHITLPYSCEAGRCGSCVATCTKGQVWMAYNEVLLDEELAKGRVLLCQGYPIHGDVELQL